MVKTRKIIDLMLSRLDGLDTNIDVIQYSMTVNLLEKKMRILKNLNKIVEQESGEKEITLAVNGTNKSVKIDMDKFNPLGGSIAYGHPFAATGARIVGSLAKMIDNARGGRGLISVCTAGGMGVTAILEK